MNKGYLYDSFCKNGENAEDKTKEFHDKSHSDNRLNVFILKDVNKELEEFKEDLPSYEISFIYPSNIRLKINNSYLSYTTTTDGNRMSTVADVEYNSSLRIDVVPTSGYEYVYDITYKSKCMDSFFSNTLVLSNITDNNIIRFREKTNKSSKVHFICDDTTGIEELIINSTPVDLSGSINTYFNYSRNDYENINFQIIYSDNYMLNLCEAYISNDKSKRVSLTSNGEKYTLSLGILDNNKEVTEYWIYFSAKRIPSNDYVIVVNLPDPSHISCFSLYDTRINNPTKSSYKIYIPRTISDVQATFTTSDGCTLLSRVVNGISTALNSVTSDSFIMYFDSSRYGENNPYIMSYQSHNSAEDIYYKITVSGVTHADIFSSYIGRYIEKTAVGTDYIASYSVLKDSSDEITIIADNGYRFSQSPYLNNGTSLSSVNVELNSDKTKATIYIDRMVEDINCIVPIIQIPQYIVTITCPLNMSLSFDSGNSTYNISSDQKIYTISNVLELSTLKATITYNEEYLYTVTGSCSKSLVNHILYLRSIKSNISVVFTKKPNDSCIVHFFVKPEGIDSLIVNSINRSVRGSDFSDLSDLPAALALFRSFRGYNELVSNINESTSLTFESGFENNYELNSYGVVLIRDNDPIDISSDLFYDGEKYRLNFLKRYNDNNELEYPKDIFVFITAKEIVNDDHYVEVHLVPEHLNYISLSNNGKTLSYQNLLTNSVYTICVPSEYNSVVFEYSINGEKCELISTYLDGVSKPDNLFTIYFSPSKKGPENPYVVEIDTETILYNITVRGLKSSSIDAIYTDLASSATSFIKALHIVNENGDFISTFQLSKAKPNTTVMLVYSKDYEIKEPPYVLSSGEADIGVSSQYTSDENDNEVLSVALSLQNISSDIDISLNIGLKEDWKKADFYQLSWGTFGSGFKEQENGTYVYSSTLSSVSTVTRSMCVKLHTNSNYKIKFSGNMPNTVWIKASATLVSSNQTCNASNGFTKLSSEIVFDSENKTITISSDVINGAVVTPYLYFGFSGFTSGTKPIIESIEYCNSPDFETYGDDADMQPYFKASDIIDLHIIHEVDITGEAVPYSSYSVTVKDDKNIFNPMVKGNAADNFYKNQMFEIYSLVCDMSTDDIFFLMNPDYYVTKVATPRLSSITSGDSTATFSLIGPIEYYDEKYLDENELMLSSTTQKTNVKKYLLRIFNNDIDVSAISDDSEITTPFTTTESKTQIARMIAQAHAMYLDETTDGKICFKSLGGINMAMYDSDTPFKLSLDKQKTNPIFEKVSEPIDAVSVNVYRNNKGAREDIRNLNVTIFVKSIDGSEEGSDIDDGSNMNGYTTVMTTENGTETYYDENGNLQSESDIWKIFSKYQNVKYVRIRWYFGKKYDASTIVFKGSDWYNDSSFRNFNEQSFNDLSYNYSRVDRDNAGDVKKSGCCITEEYIDNWFMISSNSHVYFNGEALDAGSTVEEMVPLYIFVMTLVIGIPSGYPIESDTITYNYYPEKTTSNVYFVDNPLITTTRQAEILASYLYIVKNLRIFDASSTWRGDCTLQVSDEVLTATTLGSGDDKTFENYFSGIVVKNDIDFNGGLTEKTVVALPEQKFFEKQGSVNDEVCSKIEFDTVLTDDGFEI